MFKLDLGKAEEPEIKLPTSFGSSKKQDNSRKTSTSALLITPKPLTVYITTYCGKFFKRWEYQTTLPASWDLYAGQEATVRTRHGATDWFKIGKGVHQGCILSPWLFNLYAEYIMRNAGLDEAQAGIKIQFSSVQLLGHVQLFETPWTTAHQASLSITNSQSSPKFMCIESVMPSSHLFLCRPLLLLPLIPPSIRVFSNESALCIRWPKYWSFSFNISPSNEYSGLISFRMD